jgi:hypothetical protein
MSEIIKKPEPNLPAPELPAVDFALVLSRMLDSVSSNPAELRGAIYELARVKLAEQLNGEAPQEASRLAHALETAINRVETFTRQQAENPPLSMAHRLDDRAADRLEKFGSGANEPAMNGMVASRGSFDARSDAAAAQSRGSRLFSDPRRAGALGLALRLGAVFVVVAVVGIAVLSWPRLRPILDGTRAAREANSAETAASRASNIASDFQAVGMPAQAPSAAAVPPFPLPTTFGIYAVSDGQLHELTPLPGRVPDIRVAVSTAINTPSQTTLSEGHAKFIVFKRDSATDAPDRADIRVVARVMRSMGVDESKKAVISQPQDIWVIRNIAFTYKTGPLEGHPAMFLVQPESPDFALAPGRYVLVIKGQGYDFSVAGTITDPSQCVERVNAVNGDFYTPCPQEKQP